jgi:outer membrane protein assembly factor BamB
MKPHQVLFCAALLTAASLPMAAAADYPQWRNDGSGSAADSGVELLEDISQVKLVWESEAELPAIFTREWHGGYTGPSVAEGRVFVQYYAPCEPCDMTQYQDAVERTKEKGRLDPSTVKPEMFAVRADDVVVCMDAKTGKTLWTQTMKAKGVRLANNGGLMHTQPCVKDGKVYVVGSMARVYCLKADTGEVLWESTTGEGFKYASKVLEDWLGKADPFNPTNHPTKGKCKDNYGVMEYNVPLYPERNPVQINMPQLAGTVLVMNDGIGGLTGLDMATGTQVWHRSKVMPVIQSPTVWKHGGRHFVLHNGPGGIQCTDAATGAVMWTAEGAGGNGYHGPCVSDDIMVVYSGKATMSAYAMTPEGTTKLWETDAESHPLPGNPRKWWSPVIHREHVYTLTASHDIAQYHCIDLRTGEIKGAVKAGRGEGCSSLIAGDGRVFMHWDILKADPKDFRMLSHGLGMGSVGPGPLGGKATPPDPMAPIIGVNKKIRLVDETARDFPLAIDGLWNTSAYADGFLYYRGKHRLYCVDMRKAGP